jgi:hypothetical protein
MTPLAELIVSVALICAAGIATGWTLARHVTRYMLGGRS